MKCLNQYHHLHGQKESHRARLRPMQTIYRTLNTDNLSFILLCCGSYKYHAADGDPNGLKIKYLSRSCRPSNLKTLKERIETSETQWEQTRDSVKLKWRILTPRKNEWQILTTQRLIFSQKWDTFSYKTASYWCPTLTPWICQFWKPKVTWWCLWCIPCKDSWDDTISDWVLVIWCCCLFWDWWLTQTFSCIAGSGV